MDEKNKQIFIVFNFVFIDIEFLPDMHHVNGNPLRRIPPRSHALFGTNLSNPRSAILYIFSLYYGNVYYANIVEICPYYKFNVCCQ